ncbi:DHA2 family efflux MFS transporter permease subunit [Iamia sp. SCSIO 61187]|uniref:DHA2 family efflux MFS transporter permease subunit n=1 Tax=Iamia sp. SCSIO 61187 TaxID=2722752 RepID=UPI001C63AEE3|nr:DHA2 family efflux MFS transporter permease subunit [Iamia sp. SCSIO 61187]QYG94880.1 DHA2 family efflux MFS transporter permease subunit [Iamia sp. SCSIO 61187]
MAELTKDAGHPTAGTDETFGIDPTIYARRWKTLVVLCTSLLIVIIGNTSLNVALPTLARELEASTSSLQWMVDAYALVFAGLLFTAGTIGDRFGRKGALQAGLGVFLVGAAFATVADTAGQVITARAIMGIAAAFVMPSTLSILTNVFPAHERPRAIAIWAGISGGGAAIGPIASGWLIEHYWWGSVFLINVPIILIALVAGAVLVPRSKDPEKVPLDFLGAGLSIIGLGSLVYAIIEGPHHGWASPETLLTFAASFTALGLFAAWELRARHPMLDLRLFRDRRFSVASAGMSLTFFAMFGTFFLVAQYFQLVLGYSALESGLLQLPMAAVMMSVAPQVPKLVARFGAARVVPFGLGFTATGLAIFSQVGVSSSIAMVYLSILPLAFGMSLTMTPLTTLIMSSVPLGKAGVGSAMNDTTRELGGALGVAVLGSLVTSQYASSLAPALTGLPDGARSLADSGLTGALAVGQQIGGAPGAALTSAAQQAFVDGLGLAAIVGSLVVFSAAAAAWFLLPKGAPVPFGAVPGTPGDAVRPDAAGDVVDDGELEPSPTITDGDAGREPTLVD